MRLLPAADAAAAEAAQPPMAPVCGESFVQFI